MAGAARLAARARPLSRPNPAVACIIVKDGTVQARGWTQVGGRPHAEAAALAQMPEGGAAGATIYVTLEPCAHQSERGPSCSDLIVAAQPENVVIGVTDPDPRTSGNGIARLREAGIAVDVLDHPDAKASLAGFLTRETQGRPFLTLKLAMSEDGFIAREPGQDQWITGEVARAHVHGQRARQDAILVGRGTWEADGPRLDVRLPGIEDRSPQRYVLTRGAAPDGVGALASPDAISELSEIQYLYIEGGAGAAQAFMDAGLVDKLHIYTAPITIGSGTKAPAQLLPQALCQSSEWYATEKRQLGSDTFTAYSRA
ncbi:bifunctional diaminohydroxyphosphoribosylaminopyrimidine deaminase/5-amino-6-(5-phosphoribosylamino)uracil reductase RibD [Altererythrobacter rubellus]|uniref:Riboflavin biosynthesis protein RibD n=1 Tax=Altererythrobacter rubellus TaxID=2173831 RepID=A0A9Y2BC18_9SPHN|nr:bifunctional diaminohydroxyphosphoribosylaminopyrimidine deaminase/5-amino-6-(5-phosphoribosylamino)uracil reductase RibD [Altererythrobacter rubellus]WIW96712.1 bifunctional diaminohydroxyphosphoribosylaminopyrimidine deaminase/5-amino-6-(5-phosphoribosylamino)uracil reductase RibD [Altererythrobacter rubellus]